MASNGFPPSNLISPSVRIAETDLSFIAPVQTGHRAGIIGFASKGPINIPTMVTTSRQLHTIFGQPHPAVGDPYLLYAADQYLLFGSELFIVRVAQTSPVSSESAQLATVTVPTAGGAVQIIGNVPVGTGWSFSANQFFRWRLNGILASKILVVLSNANRPAPNAGLPYQGADLVAELNSQLNPAIDGIQFFLSGSGSAALLGVQTTFSFGTAATIELVSVTSSLYGPSSVVGMGTLMTAASQTGTATQYPATSIPMPGTFDFSGFSAGSLNLQLVIDGTDNVLIDNVVQTISISSTLQSISQIVTSINSQVTSGVLPGGFTASVLGNSLRFSTNHVGQDAKLLVKVASTADLLLGLDNLTHAGTSPSCVTAPGATYSCGIVSGSSNSSGAVCFTINADSPGIDGNHTSVVITNDIASGSFTLNVFSYGNQVETWGGLVKDPTSSFYVETYIAAASNYIRIIDNTSTLALPAPSTLIAPYTLSGGTDGIPSSPDDQDTLLLGNSVSMTGLMSLSDPEQVDIDIVAIPGHTSTAVVSELLSFCENTRGDCFAIVDSPFGLTVNEIIEWQNGVHPLNNVRFDSNFGALYWPWLQTRDTFNHINVWVPPSGSMMAVYANSDNLGNPWEAPAGLNRGLVPNILDVYIRPSLSDRDQMYGNSNCINAIVQFADLNGFYAWGQKTLQRRPTALDRVNVRRMLLYIEKQIRFNSRSLLFEPNDKKLQQQFIRIATTTLKFVQSQRGITDFIIQCDSTINTPDVIDRNELRANIGVVPTRAAEFIFIQFTINRTGSFVEADTGTF